MSITEERVEFKSLEKKVFAYVCKCGVEIIKEILESYFFYDDTHRREKVEFSEDDYAFLKQVLKEINDIKENGTIPPIRKGQYCSGCSLKDICLPTKRRNT